MPGFPVRKIVPLFHKHNVDLVVTSHDHYYEHNEYTENHKTIPYLITGGGGAPLIEKEKTKNEFSKKIIKAYHFIKAEVSREKTGSKKWKLELEVLGRRVDPMEQTKQKWEKLDALKIEKNFR